MIPYMRRREFLYWLVGLVAGCTKFSSTPPRMVTSPTPTATLPPQSTSTPLPNPPLTLAPTSTTEVRATPIVAAPSPTATGDVTFTILYDNNPYGLGLKTAWGFACLVEVDEAVILFDTGGDSSILLSNMATLDKDPQAVDVVVLSHIHGDHIGGLGGLLDAGARPVVYVPAVFPASFKNDVRATTELIEVEDAQEIRPGIFTTGQVRGNVVEQALVVETTGGWVVVTGCAHPGVVEMTKAAQQATGGDIAWVMGGFHLGSVSRARIRTIIENLRELEVNQVAPMHCSGEGARAMFAEAWGDACPLLGVGAEIALSR